MCHIIFSTRKNLYWPRLRSKQSRETQTAPVHRMTLPFLMSRAHRFFSSIKSVPLSACGSWWLHGEKEHMGEDTDAHGKFLPLLPSTLTTFPTSTTTTAVKPHIHVLTTVNLPISAPVGWSWAHSGVQVPWLRRTDKDTFATLMCSCSCAWCCRVKFSCCFWNSAMRSCFWICCCCWMRSSSCCSCFSRTTGSTTGIIILRSVLRSKGEMGSRPIGTSDFTSTGDPGRKAEKGRRRLRN